MDGEQEMFVGNLRVISIPSIPMATLLFIFLVIIFIALKPDDMTKSYAKKYKYYSSIFLAFLFTCTMIVYISLGIRSVNQMVATKNNEIISLGFASVYKGSYSEETEPQWLFSLTFPTNLEKQMRFEYGEAPSASNTSSESAAVSAPAAPNVSSETTPVPAPPAENVKKLARGFGAPLWVIFLAVVGAGIFTIHIIVQGIMESINDMDHERLRFRVQQIVVHEFYILFAPLGAIIVYQLIVIAGMSKQYLTVALAVLGAGLALNVILDRALQNVKDIVGGRSDRATIDPKIIQKALENKGLLSNEDFKQAKNETQSAA